MSVESTAVQRADFDQFLVPTYAPAPFIPVRGEGSRVWDQAGRELIDLAGGIAVNALGHAHPALVSALTEQANAFWHVSNLYTNEPALRLARQLTDATFADRAFFCNSGAEANEAAFKLARRYAHDNFGPEKYEIISAVNSFHGRTFFTVSVAGQPKYSEGFGPRPEGITHVPFNDLAALEAAISEKTCAVVLEPIQGESGILPADQAYLEGVRALCDKYHALLVFDEVQTGVGRTGELYAYQLYGVTPDILSSAKGLGGGFPIGAILTTEKVAKSFGVGVHGTTFGGNPLACAVASKVVEIVNDRALLDAVKKRFTQFADALTQMGERYGVFSHVRGAGLLIGAVTSEAWAGKAGEIRAAAEAHDVMVLVAGSDVVRFAPSLLITDEEMQEGLARFERALASLAV